MEKRPLPELIEGKDIVLKKHSLDLAQTMIDYVDSDRERLQTFLPWVEHTKTVQDEIDFIKKTHEEWEKCDWFDYGIFVKDSDTYVGNIGVHTLSWSHEWAELGYWLLGKYEGKGYMSQAVHAIEKVLFEYGFNRIEIRCDPNNKKSASVPERNGYTNEGILRSQLKIEGSDGRFRDTQVCSKLKDEYLRSLS